MNEVAGKPDTELSQVGCSPFTLDSTTFHTPPQFHYPTDVSSTPDLCLIYPDNTDCNEYHKVVTTSRYNMRKTPAAKYMLQQTAFLTAPKYIYLHGWLPELQ